MSLPRSLQADELEDLLDPALGGRCAARRESAQVGPPRQVGIEGRRLDQRADVEEPAPVAPPERPAEQLDRAAVGVDEAREQAHRRRLAGAVRPEEAVDDAGRHGQVETGQRHPRAVVLLETPRREGEPVRRRGGGGAQGIGSRSIVRTWRVRPASVRTSAVGITPPGSFSMTAASPLYRPLPTIRT